MNENIMGKPKNLDMVFTAEMFEDLNNALTGINKRTLMTASFQYEDGRYMRVNYREDTTIHIELLK